ncbi:MAG: hypothetical protein JXA81_13395 [Sedimentisphaerales bacterium]|nr:hypothetical protein [Sedimentisphaerales bacterium]
MGRLRQSMIIYGCTPKLADGVLNTALIYNRSGALIGMYDKLHLQTHDQKYTPVKHLNVRGPNFR